MPRVQKKLSVLANETRGRLLPPYRRRQQAHAARQCNSLDIQEHKSDEFGM